MIIGLLKKIFRVIVGVALLPLTLTVSKAFYSQLGGMSATDSKTHLYFLVGAAAYVVMHLFFFKPNFFYNLGHECVHVLSTWLSFGRAKNLKVSGEGGSVQTTKSNFFINISPYLVPIYTIILCLVYFIMSKFNEVSGFSPSFIFLIGFTFTMHIIMTTEALKAAQPDLIKTGYLLSLSLIYVINVLAAAFIISLIFTGFSFIEMFLEFSVGTKELYILIFRQLFAA